MIHGHYYLAEEIRAISIRENTTDHATVLDISHADNMGCPGKICFDEKMY